MESELWGCTGFGSGWHSFFRLRKEEGRNVLETRLRIEPVERRRESEFVSQVGRNERGLEVICNIARS